MTQGTLENQVDLGEMLSWLHEVAPERIRRLSDEYPEFRPQLSAGRTLGKGTYRTQFMLAVAAEFVEAAIPAAEAAARNATRRLSMALKFDFFAHALTILSSSGTVLLLLLLGNQAKTKTIVVAACSFVGSICVAVSGIYRSGIGGAKEGLGVIRSKLVNVGPELEFLAGWLRSFKESDLSDAKEQREAMQLIHRSEQLCKEVRVWCSEVPGAVAALETHSTRQT
jgi:hypothetical protein